MRMRRTYAIGLAIVLGAGSLALADLRVGDARAVQAKAGVPLRAEPTGLAKVLQTLPYGTRVTVLEIREPYAQVRTLEGVTGWVKGADVVDPGALTGAGARGPRGATSVSSSELSAAGRQFDEATEGTFRSTSAGLDAAYHLVDALEGKTPPAEEVEAFIRDGRLGR